MPKVEGEERKSGALELFLAGTCIVLCVWVGTKLINIDWEMPREDRDLYESNMEIQGAVEQLGEIIIEQKEEIAELKAAMHAPRRRGLAK